MKFSALVFGSSLWDFVFSAILAESNVTTAMIFPYDFENPDVFRVQFPFDPQESELILERLGLSAQRTREYFEPDFQIFLPKIRLDFYSEPILLRFALRRDLGESAENMLSAIRELLRNAEEFDKELILQPPIHLERGVRAKFREIFSGIFSKAVRSDKLIGSFFREMNLGKKEQEILILPLKFFSPFFETNASLKTVAILWRLLLSALHRETVGESLLPSLESLISANGRVYKEKVESVIIERGRIVGLNLEKEGEVETELVFASPSELFSFLTPEQRELKESRRLLSYFPRGVFWTTFFRIEKRVFPEPMAKRVVWQRDDGSLWLLGREQISSGVELLGVTVGYKRAELKPAPPEKIVQGLRDLFFWMRDDQFQLAEIEPLKSEYYIKFPSDLGSLYLALPFSNLFFSASQLFPFMGITGLFSMAKEIAKGLKV